MTRYLEVGTEIAQRVRSGDLPPGALLAAVRVCARERGTTASTISRAYRYLAEGGVITLAARRRARVAPDGAIAASRLLEAERVFRLAGSDDPALQILLSRAGRTVVPVGTRGSFQGLRALARGNADGAAIHLRHRNGSYNAPFARALLRTRRPHLLHLWRREQGLLVAPGNPRGVTTPGDLARLRVAKREVGTGTRVLLDPRWVCSECGACLIPLLINTAGNRPGSTPGSPGSARRASWPMSVTRSRRRCCRAC